MKMAFLAWAVMLSLDGGTDVPAALSADDVEVVENLDLLQELESVADFELLKELESDG
jgi:hypothetical protein